MDHIDFDPRDHGAAGDGVTLDTAAVQDAIDAAAKTGGRVTVTAGRYLVGALFLASGIEFHLGDGAELVAATGDEHYPTVFSRVAGIEMDGPAAILNAFGRHDLRITGTGGIDGRGQFWWDRYWGPDGTGGLRSEYDGRGLRWAADYDVRRPRVLLVHECRDVTIEGITIRRSPFWTVHLCYSRDVHVDGITIEDSFGPSTDGIDIDSCIGVLVENCSIDCGDDNIVLKSGRDADGLRVGRICRDVEVRNCRIGEGLGVALGSDLSGGIEDVRFHGLEFTGTDYGFRIKSSRSRSGFVRGVEFRDSTMRNVAFPFSLALNWYPWFNAIEIPADFTGEIPPWWHVLATPPPAGTPLTDVDGLTLADVRAGLDPGYDGPSLAFDLDGYPESPMRGIRFQRVSVTARELGRIVGVSGLRLDDVAVSIDQGADPRNDLDVHRVHHQWRPRGR
ncbi:glycoside hydrolase family 28 protein [Jiangella endophytica]|uniref:glycoside hydrolase family 28 protein n=1 Tax=Jiangella endophytica TaxID=1623398 RepID=UPI000E354049|nr:glycoside hydrolase family 28 protein [Jiangella endophytica]